MPQKNATSNRAPEGLTMNIQNEHKTSWREEKNLFFEIRRISINEIKIMTKHAFLSIRQSFYLKAFHWRRVYGDKIFALYFSSSATPQKPTHKQPGEILTYLVFTKLRTNTYKWQFVAELKRVI